ncbi:hypothetical protein CAEBREN_00520 [Caenorhabditis brenneri]|uniref:Uncharacterized protein n=1 Tax=Caenorhabditis brenneri TaxID=135651 RepID=G0NI73_CAEBE|nr:hypothetical protein CAEBREN_00520 [Caenorhabditis brenneri]
MSKIYSTPGYSDLWPLPHLIFLNLYQFFNHFCCEKFDHHMVQAKEYNRRETF